ncbi:caspase-4-like [Tenrec ecaudatus]|uniref:caspase-4-like n=1 Tax=Tenrec ecaudatus TaxID=94439 RepID=UPI003F5A931C
MEDTDRKKNRLRFLESFGKEFLADFLENVVEHDYLKFEDEEKKMFYDAKREDRPRVFAKSFRQKHHDVGKILAETLLNKGKALAGARDLPEVGAGPEESAEFTDMLRLCPHEKFLRLSKEKSREIYPIKEKEDGRSRLALIICNIEFDHLPLRNGANLDIEGMQTLLEGLGYKVTIETQLTAMEMQSVLQAFAALPEHRSSDSTFLVFMSHGLLEGICGTKHSKTQPDVLSYDTIFQIFNNRNCLNLKDKPKVIITQACRGANRGELWVSDSPSTSENSSSQSPENLEEDATYKTHVEKDFIAFCSSTPHNMSWRDKLRGSLFITELIECFQKYSWDCHLEEVFRKVQQSFEKPTIRAQMPTIERVSLTRYFYLFPGN